MRRIIIIGTALAVLVGAAAAWAADGNTYGGTLKVTPKAAGTSKKPVPVGWFQTITAQSNRAGFNAAPLTNIKTTIYGMKVNTKLLPTCKPSKIVGPNWDKNCPARALVAKGKVQSQLGSPSGTGGTAACNPNLDVWNAGNNKVTYFFVVPSVADCPVPTGSAQPYTGTFHQSGKNLVLNVPLPADISTNAGNIHLYASLVGEQLTWKRITKKVKGKKVGYFSSIGCKAGKRKATTVFTDTTGSSTVTGTSPC